MIKINKTFVINLKHRTDRWKQIINNFKSTNLKLIRWNAVYGKYLKEDQIKQITTEFCYKYCSPGMIGCWLSHYSIWLHMVRNNEDNVLVLEDDAFPSDDFNDRLKEILREIPKDYDITYFGCAGTCDDNINKIYKILDGEKNNEKVYDPKKNKNLDNIIKPAFPLATHAYLISNKGAKKLLNDKNIKKVMYHIDFTLSNIVYNNKEKDFKVYAVHPPLINQGFEANGSDIVNTVHPLFNKILSTINISNTMKLDYLNNVQLLYIRKMDIPITNFLIGMIIISLLLGATLSKRIIEGYLLLITGIYIIEIMINKGKNLKLMVFELIIIMICTCSSFYIKNSLIYK